MVASLSRDVEAVALRRYGDAGGAQELGAEPTETVASVGLELAALHDPENSIPFSAAVGLLQAAAVRTGCAHFGLLLGQRNAPSQVNFSSTEISRK